MSAAPRHHARAQSGPQRAAALVGIEFQNVAEQQKQQNEKQQEYNDCEAGERQGFAGGLGIQKADTGGIEGLQNAKTERE